MCPEKLSRFVQGSTLNHGTHVAGTIAAADNGIGIIGIAPKAKIVAVKVLSEYTGSGDSDWSIRMEGSYKMRHHQQRPRAGARIKSGCVMRSLSSSRLPARVALGRATTDAYQKGVTIFASEGNEAIDKDHTANLVTLPADSPHVISIVATSPIGWAVDPRNAFLGLSDQLHKFWAISGGFRRPWW